MLSAYAYLGEDSWQIMVGTESEALWSGVRLGVLGLRLTPCTAKHSELAANS